MVIARRVPDGRPAGRGGEAVPEHEVRDRRLTGGRSEGEAEERRGIPFAEQEAGCLAGVAAATDSKTSVISSVGGHKIPPVDAYIAGYQYCAKKVKPGITTLNGYSQDFVAQASARKSR